MKAAYPFFAKLVQPQIRNSLATDSLLYQDASSDSNHALGIFKENSTNAEIASLLRKYLPPGSKVPSKVLFSQRIRHNGTPYSVHNVHQGNSQVFLEKNETPHIIERIMRIPGSAQDDILIVVRPYMQARVNSDPYSAFPHVRASIWASGLSQSANIVPLSQVESQYVKCNIPWEGKDCIAVISLSRVSTLLFLSCVNSCGPLFRFS
jgi:hypothetical protein